MSQLTIQIDDAVEQQANRVLKDLNMSKGDVVRMVFEYIVTHKQIPAISNAPGYNTVHLTDLLRQMPNVGEDEDFTRVQDNDAANIFD